MAGMTVEDILHLDKQITVLYGETGIHRRVAYIDVVEIPEGMYWTSADDFIITTGYFFASDETQLELLVRTLIRKGVAGLGIKIGKYISSIPEHIAEIAEEHAFPILQIPIYFSYREIARPLLKSLTAEDASVFYYSSVSNFFDALLRGSLSEKNEIQANAAKYGLSVTALRYIITARAGTAIDRNKLCELNETIERIENIQSCSLKADRKDTVFSICQLPLPNVSVGDLSVILHHICTIICNVLGAQDTALAVSAPCSSLLDVHQAALQTHALLNIGLRLHPERHIFSFEDYYLDLLLYDNQNHYVLNCLSDALIVPLAQADRRQHTFLLPTLLSLCEHAFSITKTSQALYLHRNTVYNRVKRIESILGRNIDDFETRYALIVACKYYRIQQSGEYRPEAFSSSNTSDTRT